MRETKRLIFVVLMTVYSVSWAEWELHGITGDGDEMIHFYSDKSTIRRNGAVSRMWVTKNYSVMQINSSGNRYMSSKILEAHNCREETSTTISIVQYAGLMGNGNVVWTGTRQEREWEWVPNVPNSVGEMARKIACSKR